MTAIHSEPSPYAGKTVTVDLGHGDGLQEYVVEDWWDRVTGGSWMWAEGNPAALDYAMRSSTRTMPTPLDNEVLYGKIGPFGYLVHVKEIVGQ